ncbi:hypothetical protein V5O48_008875 [Marasmius crinis-equi]|uniref:F-box domain-containing protein n=1 Tax=Marasmius crinis-equi TaxID=585013 RepID=A0ABR3FCN4_9AGAR
MAEVNRTSGRLLLDLPLEIFFLICYCLPITTVLVLVEVNQCLRYFLTDSGSECFWKSIRAANNIPEGPTFMSELEWLKHLFREPPLCQNCKSAYALTNWQIMRRFCPSCTNVCTRGCARNRPPIAGFPYLDALLTYTDGQGNRRFVREDLTDIASVYRVLPLDCREPFLDERKDSAILHNAWADDVDTWFGNTVAGWFIGDKISPGNHTLKELDMRHACTRETLLSAHEWVTFHHQVLPVLRAKFTPLFFTSTTDHWPNLRKTLALAWDAYLRRQTKRIRFTAPDSTVIALFPFMMDVLMLGHPKALDVESLHKLISDHADMIFRWISFSDKRLMTQSIARGYDPALVAFCYQRHLILPPPSLPTQGLGDREMAITEIHCAECNKVFSSVGASIRHVNRSSEVCFSSWTSSPSMLSLVSSPAAIALVSLSGLDCARTSCHEMDRLWGAYTCILCLGEFKGTWRECVKHFHDAGHKRDDHRYDFCMLFARLEPRVYDPLSPANDRPAWHCNYCSRYSVFPATRTQILAHVVQAHRVDKNDFNVPDDFFYVGP